MYLWAQRILLLSKKSITSSGKTVFGMCAWIKTDILKIFCLQDKFRYSLSSSVPATFFLFCFVLLEHHSIWQIFRNSHRSCSVKKVFLEISQNAQEKTSFLQNTSGRLLLNFGLTNKTSIHQTTVIEMRVSWELKKTTCLRKRRIYLSKGWRKSQTCWAGYLKY